MMKMNQCLVMAGMAAMLVSSTVQAQDRTDRGRGNFDPAQMRERRMEALKDRLEIKDDTEWKALQPLIQKVMDVQQQMFADRIRSEFRGGFTRGDRGGDNRGPENRSSDNGGDQGRRFRGGFGGGEPSAEAQALEKAIEAKASNSELKAAIAKLQESRKTKQSELEKAQADLRKVLSVRQEAILTSSGLL